MYQKMTHTLEDLKKLAAMELRDVNREELVDIDASLEKPLSSKARKSFERFFQLWKKKKCKLCILIGCWTRILRKSNSAWMLDYCSTEKKQMRSLRT